MTTTTFNFYDRRFGLKGEFLDVMISRKTPGELLVREQTEMNDRIARVREAI